MQFTVEGRGDFPLDMLRYDRCFPGSQSDVMSMAENEHTKRRVMLCCDSREMRRRGPTEGRWRSFGWIVVPGSIKR